MSHSSSALKSTWSTILLCSKSGELGTMKTCLTKFNRLLAELFEWGRASFDCRHDDSRELLDKEFAHHVAMKKWACVIRHEHFCVSSMSN